MKIPYLNVETCENVLVICNTVFFPCYHPQILSSIWALIWAKWEVYCAATAVGASLLAPPY